MVLSHTATLTEIEHHWSLLDLLDANDALDLQQRAERDAAKQSGGSR